jgi:hypothetical protein
MMAGRRIGGRWEALGLDRHRQGEKEKGGTNADPPVMRTLRPLRSYGILILKSS